MILVIYLMGDLLTRVFATICYDGCFCYPGTMNCSKQSLLHIPPIPDTVDNVDLAYNLIFQVNQEDLFDNMEVLDLSHNKLKILNLNLGRSQLKVLKLSDNPLKQINISSTLLQTLDLSWCDISHLQDGFLDMTPALEILDLSHNPLKLIHPLKSNNLKALYIHGCLFRKITFDLPQLELLDVSHNKYMTILKLESNLTTLRASYGSFYQTELTLPMLKVLDISNNKLTQIYFNNPYLEELDISWNSLRNLELIDVALKKLDISHNLIHQLDLAIDTLVSVNASYNPLSIIKINSQSLHSVDCASCQLKHIQLPSVYALNLSRNNLEAFTGEATYLDLSHNLLDAYKGKAEFVDLRGNRLSLPKRVSISGRAKLDNNPWLCKCDDEALNDLYYKAVDHVTCASPEGRTWEICFTTKLPKYMKDYPWIPLLASGVLTVLIVGGIFIIKRRLWALRTTTQIESSYNIEETMPVNQRHDDFLPSYEEALFMKKPEYHNRRSYELDSNRRCSSSSI